MTADFRADLGYLEDLINVGLEIRLAVRLIPRDVLAELREKANEQGRPVSG